MNASDREAYAVPQYDAVVERNAITVLLTPGDLTIRDGDIAMTRWGDLMLNDETYSALVRFVQFWRYNYPTLRTLFDIVILSHEEEERATAELNGLGSVQWEPGHGPLGNLDVTAFHALNERIGAIAESRGIYAGTVMLVVGRALATLRGDLGAKMDDWREAGPKLNGRSMGELFDASGNNVRHADEWRVASPPDARQMKSVRILADVLQRPVPDGASIRSFAGDVSVDVMDVLAGRDFMRLEEQVFAFANDLVARIRARLT